MPRRRSAPVSFATLEDYQARLPTPVGEEWAPVVAQYLVDATEWLRAELGAHIWPVTTATYKQRVHRGAWIRLPQHPVHSVDMFRIDGVDQPVHDHDYGILAPATGVAEITFTYGYKTVPAELVRWCVVLAAQAHQAAQNMGSLGTSGVSSVAVDDFRISFADGGQDAVFHISEEKLSRLRERYGNSAHVTEVRL